MKINQHRGIIESERLVESALESLRRSNKRHGLPAINDIKRSERNSELDHQGVDFLVSFEDGSEVPLQVKSSQRGRRKFYTKCRQTGKNILVIVVHVGDAIGIVINRIISAIKLTLSLIKRRHQGHKHQQYRNMGPECWRNRFRLQQTFAGIR